MRPTWKVGYTVAAALTVGYCTIVGAFSWLLPLQDFPNHLARAMVMSDLLFGQGATYAGTFEVHLLPVPYVLGDVLMAAAIAAFGTTAAVALGNTVVLLSLPAALHHCLGGLKVSGERRALAWILSLYLSTDWFFVKGFFAYRLAIAMLLVTLGLALRLRERWSAGRYAAFLATLIVGYLLHLTAPAFAAVALGTTALLNLSRDRSRLRRELALLLPLAAVFAWHVGITGRLGAADGTTALSWFWGTPHDKFVNLVWDFMRYRPVTDWLLLGAFLACLTWVARGARGPAPGASGPAFDQFVLCGVFLGLYVALPVGYRDAWWVDVRAVEMAVLFLLMACLSLPQATPLPRARPDALPTPLWVLAGLLAIGNAAYIARHMLVEKAWIDDYRRVVTRVPAGARVLPVHTLAHEGAMHPLLHVGAFVVIDAHGTIPYLFSGDGGYPMKYFRYVRRPYAPDDDWYTARRNVDWHAVGCNYDYLLITKPFDPARLGVVTSTAAENGAAALLRLTRSCP